MPRQVKHNAHRVLHAINRDKYLLLLLAPTVAYYVLFHYVPMYGTLIAFMDYKPGTAVLSNNWVGFKWFVEFFNSIFFSRLFMNTLILSVTTIVFNFPIPIVFALLLNEVKNRQFKKVVQTVSYMPYFISLVVVVGILFNFLSVTDGLANNIRAAWGYGRIDFLNDPSLFRPIYVATVVWQTFGWNSIIYLAALTAIDPALYEAADMDGAGRFKKLVWITLPCLAPVIITMLILTLGRVMNVGYEMVLLMQKSSTMETSDVISTYVYRRGILGGQFSFATAVGLFNSVINLFLLISANQVSKKLAGSSLW